MADEDTNTEKTAVAAAPGACLRCKGEMVEGWIADTGDSPGVVQQKWTAGVLTRGFWGSKQSLPADWYPVKTYRCVRCGYLESYANKENK